MNDNLNQKSHVSDKQGWQGSGMLKQGWVIGRGRKQLETDDGELSFCKISYILLL